MITGKFMRDGFKEGLHGTFKVTPITMTDEEATLLPESALQSRKTIGIYNCGNIDAILYVGDQSVSTTETTTSGVPVYPNAYFAIDVGRADVYGITTTSGLAIKVLEIS